MRINTITIEGLWLYADPQHIDLTGLPLIVGTGPNGAGKSAILVHSIIAGFYGRFPTKTNEECIHNGSDQGSIDIDFTVGQANYRVHRTWPRTGAATATLHVADADASLGWRVVAEKAREVTSQITDLLGMGYDTASMTWIAEQGQYGKFATALPAERFKLLAGVFNLNRYQDLVRRASAEHQAAGTTVAQLEGRVTELSDQLLTEDADRPQEGPAALTDEELNAHITAGQAELDSATGAVTKHDSDDPTGKVADIRRAYETVRDTRAAADRNARRAAEQATAQLEAAAAAADRARAETDTRHSQAIAAAGQRHRIDQERIAARQTKLTAEITQVTQTLEQLPELNSELAATTTAAGEHRQRAEQARTADAEENATRERLRTEFAALAAQDVQNQERIATLTRPHDASACFTCGQHLSAEDAAAIVTALTEQNQTLAVRRQQINAEGLASKTRGDTFQQQAAAATGEADTLTVRAQTLQQQITAATTQADTLDARRAALTECETELAAAATAHADALTAAAADRDAAYTAAATELERQQTIISRQLDDATTLIALAAEPSKEETELADRLADAETQAAASAEERAATRASLLAARDTARANLTVHMDERATRVHTAAARTEREQRMTAAQKELNSAKARQDLTGALTRAYSPSGIPAMILAGVMDQLNDAVNVSLTRLSRGELTVQLRTTRDTADGRAEQKITVYVQAGDGVRSYESLSGGQKFRVDLAIRTGLAQVIARGTGTPIETFILDEGWGALDEDGILSTVDTLHRLSETTNVLTVSHIDQVRDAFPARVDVRRCEGMSVAEVVR